MAKTDKTNASGGRLRAISVGLVLLVLLLGLAEVALRLTRPDLKVRSSSQLQFPELFDHLRNLYHEPDRTLLWKPKSDYEEGSIRISRAGFREAPGTHDPARYPIACMGNSATFGYTTPDFGETYPALLESLLTRLDCPDAPEVLNAGIVGYSSEQGRRLYELAVRPESPRVVTLLFGYNDHHLSASTDAEKMRVMENRIAVTSPLHRVFVYRALRKVILGSLPEPELRDVTPRVSPDRFRENISALVRSIHADGAVPILLTIPTRPSVPLVENPIPVIDRDGRRRWANQFRWLMQKLPEEARRPVARLIFANEELTPDLLRGVAPILAAAAAARPGWPRPRYLNGLALEAAGHETEARREFGAADALDKERNVVATYNDIIRDVARAEGATLVDVTEILATAAQRTDGGGSLFSDVVHPTPAGNRLIAEALLPHVMAVLRCGEAASP